MKKTISLLLSLLMISIIALGLVSCGEESDIPEGMQLVRGGEDLGFYFYAPEGWVIANNGKYSAAYLSVRNYLNTTFVESEMPEGYDEYKAAGSKKTDTPPEFLTNYFNSELLKLNISANKSIAGKRCDFGDAELAYEFIYSFTYESNPIKVMQVFVLHCDRFYIFTYTATDATEDSDYEYYLNENPNGTVSDIIKNFKFVEKIASEEQVKDLNPDNYVLISNKDLSGIEIYAPETFVPDYASAITSATTSDGRNINMCELTLNVSLGQYWAQRQESIKLIADKETDSEGNSVSSLKVYKGANSDELKAEMLGENQCCKFEYSYRIGAVEYSVYQVFIRTAFKDYMFTYTVSGGALTDADRTLAEDILGRIVF